MKQDKIGRTNGSRAYLQCGLLFELKFAAEYFLRQTLIFFFQDATRLFALVAILH